MPKHAAAAARRTKVGQFFRSHLRCYGDEHIKPKHHWMWDILEQWLVDEGAVPDCFIVERLHLRTKWRADRITNTVCFEASVLAEVLQGFLLNLKETGLGNGLLAPSAPWPDAPWMRCSDRMSFAGNVICFLDFVRPLPGNRMGRVKACLSENGRLFALLQMFALVRELSDTCCLWRSA